MLHNAIIEKDIRKLQAEKGKPTAAQFTVLSGYIAAKDLGHPSIIINDIVWEQDYTATLDALEEYGVTELTFSSTWSGAIEFLHFLISNGWQVTEPTEVIRKGYFNDEVQKALLLKRN